MLAPPPTLAMEFISRHELIRDSGDQRFRGRKAFALIRSRATHCIKKEYPGAWQNCCVSLLSLADSAISVVRCKREWANGSKACLEPVGFASFEKPRLSSAKFLLVLSDGEVAGGLLMARWWPIFFL